MYWVSNGREELAGVTLAAPFPLTRGYERLFLPQFSSPDGESWWNPPSTPGSQTGRSSLTPGPVLVLARPGLWSAPVQCVWPDSPSGNPICVFFHGKVSLMVNPCLPCDRASVRFCWQPSSLLLGRICPRVQSYVVLPQAWASPYQCLHMLPPFGQDVASVAPFYGRLASLPLRQAVTTNRKDLKLSFTEGRNPFRFRGKRNSGLAISSSDVLSGPGGHQG